MKKNFARGAVVAAAFGLTSVAQAIPLYFDFTGTVTEDWRDPTRVGQTITGGFVFETDALPLIDFPSAETLLFMEGPGSGARTSSTHFSLESPDFPMNSGSRYFASVYYYDRCDSADTTCDRSWAESFGMDVETTTFDPAIGQHTGTYDFTRLHFQSQAFRNPDFPYDHDDYFDFDDGIDVTSIVTLPLANLSGYYNHAVQTCVLGNCTVDSIEATFFNVDSVTRSLGPRSVPEPGTLGLLGVALAGMFFLRRRVPVRSGPFC